VLRLRGGAKKRKKKTYNVRLVVLQNVLVLLTNDIQTPKKIKHKRKKVKMSILKYYKVDSDGKVKRLRRECPTAGCGAGIFVCPVFGTWLNRLTSFQMAFHENRQYCGKCGLTYTFQPGTKPPVV
jgi:small subunit ribosomal protein S27Ae